jgi:DNA processing protein
VEHFQTPQDVLAAAPSQLREVPGVGPTLARAIATATETIDVVAELDRCRRHNIDIVTIEDDAYPRTIKEIGDPPSVLYLHGEILPRDHLAIAIVGTRHATTYGKRMAERLASSLARAGMTIISGLARGIDAAAHQGALNAGGRTMAVLGSGLLNLYPPEHKELAFDISQQGAILSELAPPQPTSPGAFPRRNRIITGMSLGVIVVQAAESSGALISARHAMEQNREVFAVPGPVDSRVSRGPHQLLRDGAKLVESADDVFEELGPLIESVATEDGRRVANPAELQLNAQEQKVLDCIDSAPTLIDTVVIRSGLSVSRVLSTISVLEMRRLIRRISGNTVVRP